MRKTIGESRILSFEHCALLLPGIQKEDPEEFAYLARLLAQNQFELEQDRIIYLMNDAVESYFLLEGLSVTGSFLEEYEGDLEAALHRDEKRYVLVLHQGENVCTLFFEDIRLEVKLYNYTKLGHFWVKGYEYLRVLEYRIAVLHDKLEYLGEDYCTPRERELAELIAFPPLNYCCYPAAPAKYVVPHAQEWEVTEEALEVIKEAAKTCDNHHLLHLLKLYGCFKGKLFARYIANQLHKKKNITVIYLLYQWLEEEASQYPDRVFDEETEKKKRKLLEKAMNVQKEEKKRGRKVQIVWEEPFVIADDGIRLKTYVMSFMNKGRNIVADIIKIEE